MVPLHSFTSIFCNFVMFFEERIGKSIANKSGDLIFLFILELIIVVSLIVSKTRISLYIPCIYFSSVTLIYFINCIVSSSYSSKIVISLVVTLLVMAVLHVFKLEKVLIWISDICIYSLSIFAITGLFFIPLRRIIGGLGKFLYITKYQNFDFSIAFEDFLHLPSIVWGSFLAILFVLPVIYFSFSRFKID